MPNKSWPTQITASKPKKSTAHLPKAQGSVDISQPSHCDIVTAATTSMHLAYYCIDSEVLLLNVWAQQSLTQWSLNKASGASGSLEDIFSRMICYTDNKHSNLESPMHLWRRRRNSGFVAKQFAESSSHINQSIRNRIKLQPSLSVCCLLYILLVVGGLSTAGFITPVPCCLSLW